MLPPEPSPERVADLLAATVERFGEDLDGMLEEMVAAAVAAAPLLASDLALEESARAMTHRWVESERRRPGDPVPVDIPPAALDIARDLVRQAWGCSTS